MNNAVKLTPPVLNPMMNVLVGIKADAAESQKKLQRPTKVGPMFCCFLLMISCLKGSQTDLPMLKISYLYFSEIDMYKKFNSV